MNNVVPLTPGDVAGDGRGGFFAVEHGHWRSICDLGNNAAIAYLILARGTGGDNRTTSWSVHTIEKYTRISRPMAKAAISTLIGAGQVEVIKGGSRPRYSLKSRGDSEPSWVWLPNALVDGVSDVDAPIERIRQTRDKLVLRLLVDMYAAQQLADHGGLPWRETGINIGFTRTKVAEWGTWSSGDFRRAKPMPHSRCPSGRPTSRRGAIPSSGGPLNC
jgi:hypothetical protein